MGSYFVFISTLVQIRLPEYVIVLGSPKCQGSEMMQLIGQHKSCDIILLSEGEECTMPFSSHTLIGVGLF